MEQTHSYVQVLLVVRLEHQQYECHEWRFHDGTVFLITCSFWRTEVYLDIFAAIFQQPIQYPIEDSQVKPSPEDPQLADRPVPSTDFILPMECMGDLLMVWDFCCLFSKALHLSPLTIEELEKSLDYMEGEAPLLIEMNFALLRVALTDPIRREEFCHKRKRRIEVSSYTCCFNFGDGLGFYSENPFCLSGLSIELL